jgi:hypothetical protein
VCVCVTKDRKEWKQFLNEHGDSSNEDLQEHLENTMTEDEALGRIPNEEQGQNE